MWLSLFLRLRGKASVHHSWHFSSIAIKHICWCCLRCYTKSKILTEYKNPVTSKVPINKSLRCIYFRCDWQAEIKWMDSSKIKSNNCTHFSESSKPRQKNFKSIFPFHSYFVPFSDFDPVFVFFWRTRYTPLRNFELSLCFKLLLNIIIHPFL